MKKTLVIIGHPALETESLTNKIIVEKLRELPDVSFRNLMELYPDFKLNVEEEQKALMEVDRIVLQFPFHWYSVPGILKEWIDKVLSYGFAYGSTGDKLHGKEFLLSFTIGGPEESYGKTGYNTFTIDELITPLIQTSNLCGMSMLEPVKTHGMIYIEGVYNVKEEVIKKAEDHAERLIKVLKN